MLTQTSLKNKLTQLWMLFLFLSNFDTVAPSRPDDQYENLQHLMDERRAEFWNTLESDLYLNIPASEDPPLRGSGFVHRQVFAMHPSTETPESFRDQRFSQEKQEIEQFSKFYSREVEDNNFSRSAETRGTNVDQKNPEINYVDSQNDSRERKSGARRIIAKKYDAPINSLEEINNLKTLPLVSSEWESDDSPINNSIDGSFESNDAGLASSRDSDDAGLTTSRDSDEKSYDQITNDKLKNLYAKESQQEDENAFLLDDKRRSPDNSITKQRKRHRENGGKYKKDTDEVKMKKPNKLIGPLYTKWSKWSRCSRHCQQTRRRRCRIPSVCGSALIKENRQCMGWRCQHEKFHLIQPEEIGPNYEATEDSQPAPRADVRVLLNYNSMFYTKWSQWSACSRTCLTSRYRSCRYPLFCGNAVIREEAYCYVQNTPCEKWYQRHKLGPDNKNGFDENLNKVYYDLSSPLGQAQNNGTVNESNRTSTNQVVFGHNKFFTENLPISPEDSAHILNINVGSSPHRFSPNRQRHRLNGKQQYNQRNDVIAKNEIADNEYDKDIPNRFWTNKNKYTLSKQRENLNKESKNEILFPQIANKHNSLKKPGYINNVNNVYDYSERKINFKQEPSDYSSGYQPSSLGRPSVVPQQCGRSKIRKSPWNLKIIGGRESPTDKWPWQVAILNKFKEVFCGGTLVSDQWILTAAHCLRKHLFARLAEHDLAIIEGHELDFRVTETVPHPLYDSTTVDNDVALLRLPHPVEIGIKVAPACVPEQGAQLPVGQECTIIGWGKERHNHFFGTEVLNEAEVPIIDEDICKTVYNDYYITQNMFCAGYRRGRIDSCAGDSGGPLLCHRNGQWYIYGITSFGEGCGKRGKFGIYSKVSNYHTWINDVIAAHAHRDQAISTINSKNNQTKMEQRHHRRHARHKDFYNRRNNWRIRQ